MATLGHRLIGLVSYCWCEATRQHGIPPGLKPRATMGLGTCGNSGSSPYREGEASSLFVCMLTWFFGVDFLGMVGYLCSQCTDSTSGKNGGGRRASLVEKEQPMQMSFGWWGLGR
jgi:hypothetical protein